MLELRAEKVDMPRTTIEEQLEGAELDMASDESQSVAVLSKSPLGVPLADESEGVRLRLGVAHASAPPDVHLKEG